MAIIDEFEESNRTYAASFDKGHLSGAPARKVAVLTCMDARIDPAKILGLSEGDAHVIRNAGGRASDDALRSLIISLEILGANEVVVIHHTECGLLKFTNEELRQKLMDEFGEDASTVDFLPFSDLGQSVIDDVNTIKSSDLIPTSIPVSGYIYHVETGRIVRVVSEQ